MLLWNNRYSSHYLTTERLVSVKDVYDTHEFNVGDGAQNLFILIPNEGHHGPQEDEDRFLDRPFIPQNAVLNKGTTIIWLNGDVGHEHNLVVTNNSTGGSVYETGAFPEFEVRSLVLNETGNYHYTDTEEYEEGFVMNGNIEVVDQTKHHHRHHLHHWQIILKVQPILLGY